MVRWGQLFARQAPTGPTAAPRAQVLGTWALVAMGIGATIGSGIFVTTGQVAATVAGPGVVLSYLVAGGACLLAALCYAEFAALHPSGGSAYSYAYATLGELCAWVIGWDLVLEYGVAGSIVAVGWSEHFVQLLQSLGVRVPAALVAPVNVPAALVMAAITAVLIRGVEESARTNTVVVAVKLGVVLFVLLVGVGFVDRVNWVSFPPPGDPAGSGFLPFGWAGVMTGAAMVFFAYIGFDAVSTHAEEAIDPGRSLPRGILVSLVVCTVLYIAVAAVLVGMVPWVRIAPLAPVAAAFAGVGMPWAAVVIDFGALAGMTSVLLVTFSGQARIFRAMARDGLLPKGLFAAEHPKFRTPVRSLVLTGTVAGLTAALVPHGVLLEMVSIGTLMAFAIVCAAVMVLRTTHPGAARPFRCPAVYVVAPLGIFVNAAMMVALPVETWLRLVVWLVVGLGVYFGYGARHSAARRRGSGPGGAPGPDRP
ncbi:amino acid permease [Frigoriglobus tundricola]|uniref:Putative amino acid permease, GabP family n=1 Tax=Frigoriglobus tundricola TaxID=2774151 RepID=A0A6M5YMI3_9BACT|nr:amino acid permease [Frigoriglobus tundricola]QJW94513.1 putative amino acid permease, GabP family [Frigoriglobus tundricola]